jgi:hypothetical protein
VYIAPPVSLGKVRAGNRLPLSEKVLLVMVAGRW